MFKNLKAKIKSYFPLALVFIYLLATTLLLKFFYHFSWATWMNLFMGGFFLVFSFFKFLNLKGFAKAYQTYDLIANKFPFWGYIYPVIELVLGVSYLLQTHPLITNLITLTVMGVSGVGVLNALTEKRSIKCVCLGTFFDLPMSKLTLFEDLLMMIMAGIMLIIKTY